MTRKELLADLNSIVTMSREEIKQYRLEIDYFRKFAETVIQLVEHEAPEFNSHIKEIFERFCNSINYEEILVNGYERMTEDFNDVAERFNVIYRCSTACSDARAKVKDCRAKIEKLNNDLATVDPKKKSKVEAELQKAIQNKKDAIENAKDKIQELIDEKEKYNNFKVKRLKHAYVHMGQILNETMTNSKNEITEMEKLCVKLKENVDQILNGEECSPEEAVEEKDIYEQEQEAYKNYNDTIPVENDSYYNSDYNNIIGMPNFD